MNEIIDKLKIVSNAENEGLYYINKIDSKIILDYIDELIEEIKNCNDSIVWWQNRYESVVKQNDNSHKKIEKAVKYINKHKEPLHHSFDEPDCDYWIATNPQDIIDILNGEDNE